MNINYTEVVEAKIKRLESFMASKVLPAQAVHTPMSEKEIEAHYQNKIAKLRESGERKTREMIEKIQSLGYVVIGGRITEKGVHTLKCQRNSYPVFGFVDPGGKLILSNDDRQNVLVINYQRKNLIVHDEFLRVVITSEPKARR